MQTPGIRRHRCGEVLEDGYVGHQACSSVYAFEEVMAEEGVLRDSSPQAALEGSDVIDAFPSVNAYTEKVLVHVRDRMGVEIQTSIRFEDVREQGPCVTGLQRLDSRLQHRVS